MRITAVNPTSGEQFAADAEDITEESILDLFDIDLSDEALKRQINNLNISADAKSWLFTIAKATIRVGQSVVKIGKKVLDVIFKIIDEFPNATRGMVICIILSMLISSIPAIGFVLGAALTPLLIALGIVLGTLEDLKDMALQRRITKTLADFETLKTAVA